MSANTRCEAVVNLRLIGSMQATTVTGETVLPMARKTRALLAVIAMSTTGPVPRGYLAKLLWSGRDHADARASLRQELQKLLTALAPGKVEILRVTRDHLMLNHDVVWIDAQEVMHATPSNPDALSLLTRDLLECMDGIDPGFDRWLNERRQELQERARNLADLVLRKQTETDAMIAAAKRLLLIDGVHEGAWRALMRAYAKNGDHGMAVHAYDQCRTVLAGCFNAPPSEETQQLFAAIRRNCLV